MNESKNDIKAYLLNEIQKNKEQIKFLNQRIRELQEIVIGRKLLKILLKKIIECCFISFDICFDDKNIL